ncbi:MAG: LysR substrate-binding domain-containing protein [Pseudomonadota bacterium]
MRRIARETQAIRDEVGSGDDRLEGQVVVAVPQGFAMAAVSPRLKAFSARRPGIGIEFRLGAQKAHMANRDADIAVRIGDPARHSPIGRRVGEIGFTICASAEYLSAAGAPMVVSDLARRRLIDGA